MYTQFLPDHLAQLCLAPLPPCLLHAICRPWRRLLSSPSFPPYLSLYAVLDGGADSDVTFVAYDAVAGRRDELPAPPMPSPPPQLWHPSFLSRRLPLQSVSAAGRLVLAAGSTDSLTPALPRPVVFDPTAAPPRWRLGPPFPFAPRRWCAAGAACGRVFVADGVGAGYDATDARSAATWDPAAASPAAEWEPLPPMRDCRFSRDVAEAVCSGGKVCMVSLRGPGAKEGAVFDLEAGRWEDMPPGMLAGWKGSAAAADGGGGDETIYVVDEERGALSAYDWGGDRWRTVVETERLKGAAEMAAGGGRVRGGRGRREGDRRGRDDAQANVEGGAGDAADVGGGGAGREAGGGAARAAPDATGGVAGQPAGRQSGRHVDRREPTNLGACIRDWTHVLGAATSVHSHLPSFSSCS